MILFKLTLWHVRRCITRLSKVYSPAVCGNSLLFFTAHPASVTSAWISPFYRPPLTAAQVPWGQAAIYWFPEAHSHSLLDDAERCATKHHYRWLRGLSTDKPWRCDGWALTGPKRNYVPYAHQQSQARDTVVYLELRVCQNACALNNGEPFQFWLSADFERKAMDVLIAGNCSYSRDGYRIR